MAGSLALQAEIFRRIDNPNPEIGLPETIDEDAGGSRRFRIYEPLRKYESRVGRRNVRFRKRMQKCGCAGNYGFRGLKPVAAFEDTGIARFAARQESECSRHLRPFLPNLIDFLIRFLELRNGG